MTDEELKNLLGEAYPAPKKNIADGVMREIAKERRRAKIRAAAVRYSSLAACLVIVTIAGLRIAGVLPDPVGDDDAVLYSANFEAADAGASDTSADNAEAKSAVPRSSIFIRNDASEGMRMFFAPAAADAPVDEAADDATEEDAAEDKKYSAALDSAILGAFYVPERNEKPAEIAKYTPPTDCEHSSAWKNTYHDIPRAFVSLVGVRDYERWAAEKAAADGECAVNIASFYEHFSAECPAFREKFLKLVSGDAKYWCDVPDASLFEEEKYDEIEEYYISGGDSAKCEENEREYREKLALVKEATEAGYSRFLSEKGYSSMSDWNVSELEEYIGK